MVLWNGLCSTVSSKVPSSGIKNIFHTFSVTHTEPAWLGAVHSEETLVVCNAELSLVKNTSSPEAK